MNDDMLRCSNCDAEWPEDVLIRDPRGGVCADVALRCPACGGECFWHDPAEDEGDEE